MEAINHHLDMILKSFVRCVFPMSETFPGD